MPNDRKVYTDPCWERGGFNPKVNHTEFEYRFANRRLHPTRIPFAAAGGKIARLNGSAKNTEWRSIAAFDGTNRRTHLFRLCIHALLRGLAYRARLGRRTRLQGLVERRADRDARPSREAGAAIRTAREAESHDGSGGDRRSGAATQPLARLLRRARRRRTGARIGSVRCLP